MSELATLRSENERLKKEVETLLTAKEVAKEKVRVRGFNIRLFSALNVNLTELLILQNAIQELVDENKRIKKKNAALEVKSTPPPKSILQFVSIFIYLGFFFGDQLQVSTLVSERNTLLKKLAEAKEQMSTTVSNGSNHALDGKPDASEKKEGAESGMVRAPLSF